MQPAQSVEAPRYHPVNMAVSVADTTTERLRVEALAWLLYLPAYGLIALTRSLPLLVAAAVGTGAGETISYGLLNSAAQEEVPDAVLECSA